MQRNHILMVFLCMGVLSAAASLPLSLDDAVKQGIENNLNLKKNLIDLSTAEYSTSKLWWEIFPSINASVGTSYSSRLFSGDGFEFNKDGVTNTAGLGLSLTLTAGIPYAMKSIRLAYQTQLLSYEDARNQLELHITKNFFSLIAERDNLASLDYTLQLAQRQYERDQVAFNNGLVGELALMQSRLGLENARFNLSAARSVYVNHVGDFLSQLGIAQDADTEFEGKIAIGKMEVDPERLILDYLSQRPDIRNKRQEIERLENAVKQLAYTNKAPSLRLQAEWNTRNFSPFSDTLSGSALLNIPIDPWIPGTGKYQSVRSAREVIEKARLDLQITEDAAAIQIRSLAANLRNSWDSIEIARLSLNVAERSYQLTEQGFRNGTVESLKLEDARNNLVNARQRLLQAELSYFNMILDISAALNINWKDFMQ